MNKIIFINIFLLNFVFYTCVFTNSVLAQKKEKKNDAVKKENRLALKARKGDGIYSFLRRYDMNQPCSRVDFLLENDLNINNVLYKGKVYKLPIIKKDTLKTKWREDYSSSIIRKTLKYNKDMVYKGVKGKKNPYLWIPTYLISCEEVENDLDDEEVELDIVKSEQKKSEKPASMGEYPIFGFEYSNPPKLSTKLKNKVFYVVSGHGGPDPGAIAKVNNSLITEDEYAYDVALRFTRHVISHGAKAYMIVRDDNDGIRNSRYLKVDHDEKHYKNKKIPLRQLKRLSARTKIVNQLYGKNKGKGYKDQYMVAIHIDGRTEKERIDMFFYYDKRSSRGKLLAIKMKNFIKEKYAEFQAGRGYEGSASHRNLYVLKKTKPIGLFVEIANLHNKLDRRRIFNPKNREAVAKWLCDGFLSL